MITRCIISLVLVFICQIGYGQKDMKQIFQEFSSAKNVEKVSIGKITMTIAKAFTDVMGVDGIEAIDLSGCSKEVKNDFSVAISQLKDSEYETMITSNEDGNRTKVMVRIKKDTIRELIVLTSGSSPALVRIKGKIKLSDLQSVLKEHGNGC